MKKSSMIMIMVTSWTISMMMMTKKKSSKKSFNSIFECGFKSQIKPQSPFSTQFILFTFLFLLMETEVIFILPSIANNKMSKFTPMTLSVIMVTLIILASLEWKNSLISWTK